ncbi:MAG TPA: NADH-quinone oxidoreductase subunit N [Bacteroidia bacterium]|nr:NADH-quinone oxidoreductase subunit N [Bacteroidia bacterium]
MKVILALTGLGVLAMLAELFRMRKIVYPLMLAGLAACIGIAVSYWWLDDGPWSRLFSSMILFEGSSVVFSVIILTTAFLWFIMSGDFFKGENSRTDHAVLVIFSLVGAIILTSFSNMTMLFLGVEILSIPVYVLAGANKSSLASNEASMKYFLMGSFASAFLLFGIALVYGGTGSFDLRDIGLAINSAPGGPAAFVYGGIVMMIVGLLFKLSAVPFHFWTPDVYEGAPTQVTAYMSTVVKTAAIVTILRLFLTIVFAGVDTFWIPILAVCTGLTFFIGNITAAVQENVKRMLAYSSISHAGFLLLAVVAFSSFSAKAIIYYTAAYSIASIAAFTVLINVASQSGKDGVDAFNGLGKKNPLLAMAMTIALLSLGGIPPTAGFFGKYYVLNAALNSGHVWLTVIGILASLVGVYYYFRIIIAMYFKEAEGDHVIAANNVHQALLFITAVITLVLGLLPDLILNIGTIAASGPVAVTP